MNKLLKFITLHWQIIAVIIYIINIALILFFNPFNVVGDYTESVIFWIVVVGFFNLLLWIFFKSKLPGAPLNTKSFIFKVITSLFLLFFIFGLIFAIGYYLFFTPWTLTILVTILS